MTKEKREYHPESGARGSGKATHPSLVVLTGEIEAPHARSQWLRRAEASNAKALCCEGPMTRIIRIREVITEQKTYKERLTNDELKELIPDKC